MQLVFVKERVRVAAVQLIELGARPLYRLLKELVLTISQDPWLQYDPGCL